MAYQAHPVPRGAHAGLYGSEGAQNSHGGRLSGRQVRARAQHHRLHHRPRPRQHPLRPPDHRRRSEVQPPPRGPYDPRQQAPEGEGARRQGQGQRQHNPPEVVPGRDAHPDRIQQRLGSGLHACPLYHRRRARPLGDQRRHRGRPVGAGRSTSGHILQRQGGRGLDPDHQGQQQHRDEFLPRHAGTLVPPLPRVWGVQRDRVRQYPLRPGGQEDPREKVVEPQERRLVELPGLRLPDPRGRHAKAAGQVDRRQPGRLQKGRPFFLAQCLLEPVDSVGEDRPQVPRRQG